MLSLTILSICFFGCLYPARGEGEDGKKSQTTDMVARKDYNIGKDWQPRQIMGRDFWHILGVSQDTQPDKGNWVGTMMRELVDRPLFKESGLNYGCVETITVPGSNKVSIAAMTPHRYLELIETRAEAPFFIMPSDVRFTCELMKHFDCDNENYMAWKSAHPNFMGCVSGETDNDFWVNVPWNRRGWTRVKAALEKKGDKELIETVEREFPKPKDREELAAQYMKGLKAFTGYFFNDADKANCMCAASCFAHYFYEAGAGMAWLETTNTASPNGSLNYRHQVSLSFIRGAARQHNKNWAWYIAVFYNGYDDKGKFSGNNFPNYRITREKRFEPGQEGKEGPEYGMSRSLLTRDTFLAYLSGASFVQHESWWNYLNSTTKGGSPIFDLSSPLGKAWEDWFEFTRKNPDRGASYAPVALLIPFEQGYPNYGGKSWQMFKYERPDWMIDAFMFTAMPHSPVTKNGDEGALSNSPYGDIYDVITPNTPTQPVALDVLNNYKVAVMLGKYPKSKALAERLMEYVENGGTLLLNIQQVNAFFPTEFLGVERAEVPDNVRDMYAVKVEGSVRSTSDGKTFDLPESYEMEAVKLKGAVPLLEDAGGNILACKNRFGKGNVIVSTVDCLVPKNSMDDQAGNMLEKMVYGKNFPFVEYFLKNIVSETLPVEVKGDIEYGLNKLSDGWLLYLINNKGVTKFTNKEQTFDMSKTAKVEVSLRSIKASAITELREQKIVPRDDKNNSFTVDVPPGNIRVVKIKR
ncbi:MAG: hypothetical protein WCS96_12515 [Victivallales bacterium]